MALLGPVKAVRGFGAPGLLHRKEFLFNEDNADSWTIPGNNVVTGALEFESGTLISVHINGNTAAQNQTRFELYGDKGRMTLGDPDRFDAPVKVQLPESEEFDFPFTHGYNGKNVVEEPHRFDGYGNRGVGVAELAYSIRAGRQNRLSKEYGLHCQEVLCGLDIAVQTGETYVMKSRAEVRPLTAGYFSTVNGRRADAERSIAE